MATTVTKGLIGKEDISFNPAGVSPESFDRTAAGGGTQAITKLALEHLNLEDAADLIAATNAESALQELALNIASIQEVASQGQGPDLTAATILTLDDNSLYFRVNGTTQIQGILQTAVADGRLLVLQFLDSLIMEPGTLIRLNGGRFRTQAGDFMMLMNDGNVWYEIARWTYHGDPLTDDETLRETDTERGPMLQSHRDFELPSGWIERLSGMTGPLFSTDQFKGSF